MAIKLKFYTKEEFDADREEITRKPGSAWFCPWYYDPEAAKPRERIPHFLSIHYIADWSMKRPPIVVVCPNGRHWCIDQKSSNGDGWKVTGTIPLITAHPSIDVGDYHGWLVNGEFSNDIEGRTYKDRWR